MMTTITVTAARKDLYKLVDSTYESHDSIFIKGKRHNAVLVSEGDWLALQETLYLMSQPGIRKSILDGMNDPLEECEEEIEW